MEAPVIIKKDGRYWLIASDCTGWAPNPARSAVADHPLGPWTELGNPCDGPDSETTFHSQGTFLLKVPGPAEQVIFMADRWMQDDLPSSSYVWLPVVWEDGRLRLRWVEAWNPQEYWANP